MYFFGGRKRVVVTGTGWGILIVWMFSTGEDMEIGSIVPETAGWRRGNRVRSER
jgi:hypothetical protein